MADDYSFAESRQNLAALVHELEKKDHIQLTRRGQPVAVLLSMRAYRRLTAPKMHFWDAYQAFRQTYQPSELDVQPDIFETARDTSPGREVNW